LAERFDGGLYVTFDDGGDLVLAEERGGGYRVLAGNPCHEPAGSPEGGEFCGDGGTNKGGG
jgi:hypothetical protein